MPPPDPKTPTNNTLDPKLNKTEAVMQWVRQRIEWQVYLPNQRVPSIRKLAQTLSVSPFTITQAYEQLVATNILVAKPGSGFYVQTARVSPPAAELTTPPTPSVPMIDTRWLIQHMFGEVPLARSPSAGILPSDWLHYERLDWLMRQVSSQIDQFAYQYGAIQGYLPLRDQLSQQMAQIGINVHPEQVISTGGVSQAVDMVARALLNRGDAVLVDVPGWFWLTSCLQQQGLRVLSVTRDERGPDIEQMQQLMQTYRPKLYVTNSVLHNPTSYNLHPARAHQVLNLMHQYDAYIVEDDLYRDFDPGGLALRYATLDQCERVFYVTGVSKSIGASWRVGLVASPADHVQSLLRTKLLSSMTCPEFSERMIHTIWTHGDYRRQNKKIQQRLYTAHQRLRAALPKLGIEYPSHAQAGMFLWIDTGVDATQMALAAYQDNWLLAPGQLFYPNAPQSTHLRLNVATTSPKFLDWLKSYLEQHRP